MKMMKHNHSWGAALISVFTLACCMMPGLAQATTTTYSLSNHPSSGDSPFNAEPLQAFGLRMDGLLTGAGNENYIFDFDNAASTMWLTWDDMTNTLHIFGRTFGAEDATSGRCFGGLCTDANNDGWADGTDAVWTIDFTYNRNVGPYPGDTGGFQDILVDQPGHENTGTLSSALGNFDLRDHYGLYDAAFVLGDDPQVSQFTGVLTGWGWLDHCQNNICNGSDDGILIYANSWLFEATVVPVPAAVWLFGSGLAGLIVLTRRKVI